MSSDEEGAPGVGPEPEPQVEVEGIDLEAQRREGEKLAVTGLDTIKKVRLPSQTCTRCLGGRLHTVQMLAPRKHTPF
jgi:hypothetical protein